ncbi:protein IcmB (DotO) [Legionella geestiana]|uniref:Protein IcmB (DotO) n=1 Tax=Legionella geestiana TaxID=45065 RepID=A0A0W0TGP0_9GAMM|nr:hypothetical protein [Legionella geestiana]KTC94754.1 protein IcmB (DotO) [Legionella geestiana]QBS12691.1 hypothetical protein E4T54_08015 [Legionella geestiana]QDQ39592.1 hypothetical protein E3226_003840 [Legionella geestiana]STX54843.1 protein IcmB (DotO) [Legionella geestiana]
MARADCAFVAIGLGPAEARRVLASLFPNGSVARELEARLAAMKEQVGLIEEEQKNGVVRQLVSDILEAYSKDPNLKSLPSKTVS